MTTKSETPQYPPGLYSAADSESLADDSDSLKFNGNLYLRNETQPRPMSPTRHRRPSKWRRIITINRSRPFARFTYAACLILVLIIWGVANLTFAMQDRIHKTKYSTADLREKAEVLKQIKSIFGDNVPPLIFMKGHLRGFDPEKSLLSVEWEGLLVDLAQNDLHLGSTYETRGDLAIFRDISTERDLETENLIATLEPNRTEAIPPLFRVHQPAPPPIGSIGRSPQDTLSTDIGVGQLDNGSLRSRFFYPYDRSQGTINFAMSSNDSVRLYKTPPGTILIPILGALITDSILNYQIDIWSTSVCSEPLGCQLDITLELERPGLVKAVVILSVVINWAITFSICVLTGEAIILNRKDILGGSDMLSLCLSSLFALPSVRSILPGAPPFGCLLDMVGIIPNIILISLCTATFAMSKVIPQ